MKFLSLIFGLLVYAQMAFCIEEQKVLSQVVKIIDKASLYKVSYFETQNGLNEASVQKNLKVKIYYTKFGVKKGSKGSLVIVPGRTESSLKFTEVAYDFIQRGYSPVYAIDHRGQGFSQTVTKHKLPDTQIGHIELFDHYIQDFRHFIDFIVLDDPAIDKQNLFMFTNSMGGAIALRYFQQNPLNIFKKAALSGSMIKILTDKKLPLLTSNLVCDVPLIASIATQLKCYGYTPGESAVNFNSEALLPDGRTFPTRTFYGDDPSYDKNLTSSYSRFVLNDYIWSRWPQTIVGGPSIKWTAQSFAATKVLREHAQIKKIKNKIFLLIAKKDFRSDPKAQKKLCQTMGPLCVQKTYNAFHEIHMEQDAVRNQALNDVWNYFEKP